MKVSDILKTIPEETEIIIDFFDIEFSAGWISKTISKFSDTLPESVKNSEVTSTMNAPGSVTIFCRG